MKTSKMLYRIPVITMAALLLVSCNSEKKDQTTAQDQKVQVKVETVTSQDVEQTSEFTATVEASVTNKIAPQMAVRIDKVFAEVGDKVRKGQKLAQMDQSNLTQSKVQMENIEAEFKRLDELYKIGGVSKSQWEAQKTSLEIAKTSYRNLSENTQLISPINGVVTARNYDSGDMFSMGTPIFVVEEIRPVKLLVNISETLFTQVKKGMPVDVKLDVYGDETFAGKVSLVYPSIDSQTRTFPVEITVANNDERVRPGMFARITINFGVKQNVVVPDLAIVKQSGSGDRYIYVYKDGKVSYNKVELGRRMGDKYELISGVENGDQVVVTGQSRLNDGMEVEIVK
ncbi:efflux transporter periplasmic adaptor subunit [Macellibacteroides sp. HH-ZS]|nr:efflux transporter periplasmic adaptor subunit [Macellibacteroides sp. HH-ZS]